MISPCSRCGSAREQNAGSMRCVACRKSYLTNYRRKLKQVRGEFTDVRGSKERLGAYLESVSSDYLFERLAEFFESREVA